MARVNRYVWVCGKRYHAYEKCGTYGEAIRLAKKLKKKNKRNKYFIITYEVSGFLTKPTKVHVLYCTHFMKII